MATELDPGPINPTIGFLPRIGVAEGSEHFIWVPPPPPTTQDPPPPHSSASSDETSESRMNSMLCSRATAECQHESRISQPSVIFGRIFGSELIRSKVCIMASTLWMPYCSRTAPHLRSCTCEKEGTAKFAEIKLYSLTGIWNTAFLNLSFIFISMFYKTKPFKF